MAGTAYGRRDRPTSGAAHDPQPRAAGADTDDRLRPMMMESAMLPDSRCHYPDRCPPQDGDGDGSDTDTDLGMPIRCTGEG
jgi:hypothetical protein